MLAGARLANDAVYAGEGFVAPDGTLTATLVVPPTLALGSYQLLVGNTEGRNWPAGTTTPIEVVSAPPGAPMSGNAVVGPTVTDPYADVDFTTTSVGLDFGTSASVTAAGVTTATVSDTGPTVSGFTFATDPPTYYYLHTTATFTGQVEVCVYYDDTMVQGGPFNLLHYVNGAWVTLPDGPNSGDGSACGMTDSFSPFVVAKRNVVTLTKVQQCRQGGWATSTNPVFTSQAKCVTYIALGGHTAREVITVIFRKLLHHLWW